MDVQNTLKFNLLQNAFDYLNCSLEFVIKAKKTGENRSWKFALINISVAIELLLKERLRSENALLLYNDINTFKPITRDSKTVSFSTAIERLRFIDDSTLKNIDRGRLSSAQKLRNQMIHYDVELKIPEAYQEYANLFNFVEEFFICFMKTNCDVEEYLQQHINKELWEEEKILNEYFLEEFTCFEGEITHKENKVGVEEAQEYPKVILKDGTKYDRIRYGDEYLHTPYTYPQDYATHLCHDCLTKKGWFHLVRCDMEVCPKCKTQLISCGCLPEYNSCEEQEKACLSKD
ncbi:MAG: hypothetical protein NTY22_04660 [Proteobacteria bacterium]|nr:hypothetical protein [Pseudomonadota bacterium]